MGPQSRPVVFNSSFAGSRGCSDLRTDPVGGRRRRAHFPRGERHDRFSGRHKPPWKVACLFGGKCYRQGTVLAGRGTEDPCRTRPKARAPGLLGPFDWDGLFTVHSDRGPSRTGLLPRWCSRSVANRLAPHPTRLETRTKESNMCASHWVLRNLKAQ